MESKARVLILFCSVWVCISAASFFLAFGGF